MAYARAAIGVTLIRTGQLAGAEERFREVLTLSRKFARRDLEAALLDNLAWILWVRGDLPAAGKTAEEAAAISRQTGQKRFVAFHLFTLGTIARERGDLAAARTMHEESLALRNETGQKGRAAESQIELARIAIEEGNAADAEILIRKASNELGAEGIVDEEANAVSVLIQALVAQGKLANTGQILDRARALSSRSECVFRRLQVAFAIAGLDAALGGTAKARKELESVLSAAERASFYSLQLDARLALGQMEMRSEQTAAGRARLETLEAEATAKGYGLIARKAAEARAARPQIRPGP